MSPHPRPPLSELPRMNPGPVCRLDLSGVVELANDAARRICGGDDVVGRSWLTLSPTLTPPIWREIVTQAATHQYQEVLDDRTYVFTVVHPDGGECAYVYGTDITRLKDAERALERQAAELGEMARFPEMNPGPVCRLDRAACVVLANRAARELFDDPALVGKRWTAVCPEVDAARWEAILAATELTAHEARIGGRELVFTYTPGADGSSVFVYGADITAQKLAEVALRQADKLATLGTLAAGVAHELNNPAAAAQRAARQMTDALAAYHRAQGRLGRLQLTDAQLDLLAELDAEARRRAAGSAVHPVTLGDREDDVERWLEAAGVPEAWDLAPRLAGMGYTPADLAALAARLAPEAVAPVLAWLGQAGAVYALLDQLCDSSTRVSEIIGALKAYSFVGQAPLQAVDVNEGIRNTLVVLRSRLTPGVTVHLDLAGLPAIEAYGRELNQVWTHVIDNAVDAMGGRGTIHIRTRQRGNGVVVEIRNDGPAIPDAIRSRIFDPFFTTKPPGQGTGLGLHTSYSIVVQKHGGTLDVVSEPGDTCFTVTLPPDAGAAAARGS